MRGTTKQTDWQNSRKTWMHAVYGMAELLKEEEAYAVGNKEGIAQAGYKEWIIENPTNKYMRASKSVGINRIKEAKGNAQLTLWASMMKSLDSAKGVSWRLWSRMLTETLPTNHKLSRMAESNSDNIYKWVYKQIVFAKRNLYQLEINTYTCHTITIEKL